MLRLHTVVGSVFLAADQQLGVEQLAVGTSADLINEDGARDVFAIASLREEGLERATLVELLRIGVRTAVSLEAVLKEVPEEVG
jgi:hypothetical protein